MARKTKWIVLLLCILMLILSGCSGNREGIRVLPMGKENPDPKVHEHHEALKAAETQEEALELVLSWLEEAEPNYQVKVRDYFYKDGEKRPGYWVFAVNDLGEWLDVYIADLPVTDLMFLVNGSVATMNGLQYYRKNEMSSYYNSLGFPHDYISGGTSGLNDLEHGFTLYFAGNSFAVMDTDSEFLQPFYWNGKWTNGFALGRPDPTVVPGNTPVPAADYKTYRPMESIEAEVSAMQSRLEGTGLGYTWEMKDAITVDGVEYPVKWMFAQNEEGEWVDVVFSEDPDFAYYLNEHREIFWTLREPERSRMNAKHPGREQNGEFTDEWLVQDVFYAGYSYYMQGCGLAFQDCGSSWPAMEWSDELGFRTRYFSREKILYVNVIPEA